MTMFMRLLRDVAQKHGLCILVSSFIFPFLTFFTPTIWGIVRGQAPNADQSLSYPHRC
jgi:hypothetical protein